MCKTVLSVSDGYMAGKRSGLRGQIKTRAVIYVVLAHVRQHRPTASVISAASARKPITDLLIIHPLPSWWPVICTVAPDTNSCRNESHDNGVLWYCEHASDALPLPLSLPSPAAGFESGYEIWCVYWLTGWRVLSVGETAFTLRVT